VSEAPTIDVRLKLTTELPERYLGTGEDGPQYGPMTLADAIVSEAARLILLELRDDARKAFKAATDAAIAEVTRETVAEVVRATLAEPIQARSTYGTPQGDPLPLREHLAGEVRDALKLTRNASSRYDDSPLAKIVHDEARKVVAEDLKAAMDTARQQVRDAIRDQAAELVAQAARRAVGV
jgi:hypothetical protein